MSHPEALVDKMAHTLDVQGAQIGDCGHEPGDARECGNGCWELLTRYANAVLDLFEVREERRSDNLLWQAFPQGQPDAKRIVQCIAFWSPITWKGARVTELSESVAGLIEPRLIPTEQVVGGVSRWTVVKHESLLELLAGGTGASRGPKSSDTPLPIDSDALEMLAQIIDQAREWSRNAHTAFRRVELAGSIRTWAEQFETLYEAHNVADEVFHDHIRQLDTWARWIEDKFNPDKKLEWPLPCPRCKTTRIAVNTPAGTVEQFAVEINLTKQTITCRATECDEHWYGVEGMVAFMNEHDGIAGKTELRKLLDLNT